MSPKKRKDQVEERKQKIAAGAPIEEVVKPKKKRVSKKPAVEATVPDNLLPQFKPFEKDALKIVWIPIDDIFPNPDNPNEMDDKQFNNLVKAIREIGFREPLEVRPITDKKDSRYNKTRQTYELIGGEHRHQALRLLKWEEVPCMLDEAASTMSKDEQDMLLVRRNMIKGELSPTKFTKLWERLLPKYGSEIIETSMGFADAEALEAYILDAAETLPTDEMKQELKKKKNKIKTIEDLSRVLNSIWNKYGSTVELDFLFFEYGGATHAMITMDKKTREIVEEITTTCSENRLNINPIMNAVLQAGWSKTLEREVLSAQKSGGPTVEASEDDELDELFAADEGFEDEDVDLDADEDIEDDEDAD